MGMAKVSRWADKLAVETEPGLTNAQLMVILKPPSSCLLLLLLFLSLFPPLLSAQIYPPYKKNTGVGLSNADDCFYSPACS